MANDFVCKDWISGFFALSLGGDLVFGLLKGYDSSVMMCHGSKYELLIIFTRLCIMHIQSNKQSVFIGVS